MERVCALIRLVYYIVPVVVLIIILLGIVTVLAVLIGRMKRKIASGHSTHLQSRISAVNNLYV